MKPSKHFASDNFAPVHPAIFKAIAEANTGHVKAYGDDPYTDAALKKLQAQFGETADAYFVFGGTGANVLGLKTVTESHHAIICAESAHINVDECGAPEKFTGCKILALPSPDGKIRVEQIEPLLAAVGNMHHSQPKVISISQPTEYGTVYTPEEIETLAQFAHQHELLLHVDGARLCNAAAHLEMGLRDITGDVGVDVLSFGGAKNGMMFGEAVIFFKRTYGKAFPFIRKQGMQLFSKMRFIAAQFDAYLTNDLWLKNARHANDMAQLLAKQLAAIPGITITQPVEANAVFAILPKEAIPQIQQHYFFYVWNEATSETRLMTAFDTTQRDVRGFVNAIQTAMKH
ncbi:aromatic amino acid beta-eliminating lyase/threonine aldolase [Candidatus Moduliflexus flocculans]|uniref:Aromatic amino acid beta-eliminating lyase/threonine aldolase n=1 Tax=Candidatus Moduliflexus flocculans TaxID=1499966 RepID=A0A0S6W6R3_9BACT|nr:aromatic amino acid beta-eliminating lyase/threonine aldolase [Candidatus Moduliflexus flocculans]